MRRVSREEAINKVKEAANANDYRLAMDLLYVIDRTSKEEKATGDVTDTVILHNKMEESLFSDLETVRCVLV